ncbi:Tn3 family transposase, partial [Escherichia coli]|nr:Tn3 family transposase [Escherichia coli]MBN4779559.1 Tn3 family transposase [Escherichia coli]
MSISPLFRWPNSVNHFTHVSDQFAPFACQSIPATVSEAPYILDGLLMNEVGRHVREQY